MSNDNGWMRVYLRDYFFRNGVIGSGCAERIFQEEIIPWCHDNLRLDYWRTDGVTKYSFRIEFKDPEDALHFKLKFG